MAFLFSWTAVLPLALSPELPVEPFQILGAFAGPTLAAAILTHLLEGRNGLRLFFSGIPNGEWEWCGGCSRYLAFSSRSIQWHRSL
jgi:hypothetical protein